MSGKLLSWVAGIVDGEGCISLNGLSRTNVGISPYIRVEMTSRKAVERVCKIVGIGQVVEITARGKNHRNTFQWALSSTRAVQAVSIIRPHLFLKKRHAEIVLLFNKACRCRPGERLTKEKRGLREFLVREIRKLNKRGT